MDREAPLPTSRLQPGTVIAQARDWPTSKVTLDSPALDVMTDLARVKAATVSPTTTLPEAEQIMIYQGVRMLFVVSEMPVLEGLITTTDLHGERQMRLVQQRGSRYDELTVADVMTPLAMLDAIELEAMKSAVVGNVIAALKRHGRNHLLVVEPAGAEHPDRVRGIISRAQIERQLGTTIDIVEVADTFAEIGKLLS
jgi:CBS domain-containing protein